MARLVVPLYPHHVTQRGNRRQRVFLRDSDYRQYLEYLADACRKANTDVWAYCLMPNHVHLVMVPRAEDGLRAALGEAHRRYTCHINIREGWQGHLWQERFHSFVLGDTHLLAALRYVECNPVRAGICKHPQEWPWSSARAHLSGHDDGIVQTAPMRELIGDWSRYLGSEIDGVARNLMQRHTRTGRPLGDDRFIDRLEQMTGRTIRTRKRGPTPKGDS